MTYSIRCENLSKLYRLGSYVNAASMMRKKVERMRKLFQGAEKKAASWEHSTDKKRLAETQREGAPEGYFWALKDINLEIQQGDRVAIIGRNGSGKSTLLKIFSKITRPTTGVFQFRGRLISLLEIGAGFHSELTGKENIFLNGAIMGMSLKEVKARYAKIVAFSELEKFINTPVKHYSSGMHVKLAFAVAAHLESEILIIDEILAVGDAAFQKKCLDKMFEMSRQSGRTLLFVSHDMRAIHQICDKAIEISQGQIIHRQPEQIVISPEPIEQVSASYLAFAEEN